MKIGIVQMPMAWTLEDNLATLHRYLAAYHLTVDTLIFPELSLSGFHRHVRTQSDPERIGIALRHLSHWTQHYQVNVCVGLPYPTRGRVYNRYLCIDRHGDIAGQWDKIGLTDSERTYFTAGTARPIITIDNVTISAFLCREADDVDDIVASLHHQSVDVMLWPSYILRANEASQDAGFYAGAAAITKALHCMVIQCNWPSALNDTAIQGMGNSVVIGTNGQRIAQLPQDAVAVGLIDTQQGTFSLT